VEHGTRSGTPNIAGNREELAAVPPVPDVPPIRDMGDDVPDDCDPFAALKVQLLIPDLPSFEFNCLRSGEPLLKPRRPT
jgi:hypothetical protein